MVDIREGEAITFAEAAKQLPRRRGGKRPHVATLHRWATEGCRGIRLDYLNIGMQRCTTMAALQAFFQKLTDVDREGGADD